MAETLTMESNVETTSIDNLSEEEKDSLQVGEKMEQAQEQLLAGKYKNAEELEKGYLELQQKLSNNKEEEPQEEAQEEESESPDEVSVLDRMWDEATSGNEFSEELTKEIQNMSPTDIANAYLDYRQKQEQQPTAGSRDFSTEEITQLKGIVGGDKNYTNMIDWAQKSLNEQEVKMFDAVMERGDPLAAFFAVRSLAYAYNDAIGYDGNMVQGKAPRQSNDQFRSQQEVVRAMGDPRYEDDPAYRREIMDKLERSPNVNF
jgi:rRNA maturation endonuclease Nob1